MNGVIKKIFRYILKLYLLFNFIAYLIITYRDANISEISRADLSIKIYGLALIFAYYFIFEKVVIKLVIDKMIDRIVEAVNKVGVLISKKLLKIFA